jgi:hypothetical protein
MDALQGCFGCVLGEIKAPLACVIQDVATVPPEADNLAANHKSPKNEKIARTPHQDAAINN